MARFIKSGGINPDFIRSDFSTAEQSEDRLCSRCAQIDLEKIFHTPIGRAYEETDILNLGKLEDIKARGDCDLCKLFETIILDCPQLLPLKESTFWIRAVSMVALGCSDSEALAGKVLLEIILKTGYWVEFSKPWGYLAAVEDTTTNTGFGVLQVRPKTYDLQLMRSWFNFCCTNHTGKCAPEGDWDSFIDMKVIDCHTSTIVASPTACRYVALSYVWGSSSATSGFAPAAGALLSDVPTVVRDSMALVVQLDMRYLWVDRYCIDQSNSQEVHDQVQNMDTIYANAQLTIVAASGGDPDFGLPGAKTRPRTPQPFAKIRNMCIVWTLPTMQSWLNDKSVWATRAWTYQEGLLSKRRMVFTDHQVFYDCGGMHCKESWNGPFENFKDWYFPVLSSIQNPWDERDMSLISTYSEKRMSYTTDRLNAIQGIFQYLSKQTSDRVIHIAGIRVFRVSGLNIQICFLRGLLWDHHGPGKRQAEWPSWSWTGWNSPVKPDLIETAWDSTGKDLFIRLEERDGTMHELPSSFEALSQLSARIDNTIRFLHLHTSYISATLSKISEYATADADRLSCRARLNLEEGWFAQVEITHYEAMADFERWKREVKTTPLLALALLKQTQSQIQAEWEKDSFGVFMLVENQGEYFERVGLMYIPKSLFTTLNQYARKDITRNPDEITAIMAANSKMGNFRIG
jgi:hypothetical protein